MEVSIIQNVIDRLSHRFLWAGFAKWVDVAERNYSDERGCSLVMRMAARIMSRALARAIRTWHVAAIKLRFAQHLTQQQQHEGMRRACNLIVNLPARLLAMAWKTWRTHFDEREREIQTMKRMIDRWLSRYLWAGFATWVDAKQHDESIESSLIMIQRILSRWHRRTMHTRLWRWHRHTESRMHLSLIHI